MRLQVIDPSPHFSCGSCTACCDQPWHTHIEVDKARALDKHDFSKYPQLAGKKLYHKSSEADQGNYVLAKGEGTRCLFLDHDGLCIIHKEMGIEAKPMMCRRFPYLPTGTHTNIRVSVNFGCPSVQAERGEPLAKQTDEIAQVVEPSQRPSNPDAKISFNGQLAINVSELDALIERAIRIFDGGREDDVWHCFAELLTDLVTVGKHKEENADANEDATLVEMLRAPQALPDTHQVPEITEYSNPSQAPSPSRLLFAATIFRDTVPRNQVQKGLNLFKRLALLPKLMSLAKLSGTYPSLVLAHDLNIPDVLNHPVGNQLDEESTQLLLRYFRSRFWQQMLMGTRLSVVGGVHQHIHDFNAIIFLARAEAQHFGASRLSYDLIRKALTHVEFHFANQSRSFDQKLIGWFQTQLDNPVVALQSLRLMSLKKPIPAEAETLTQGVPALA